MFVLRVFLGINAFEINTVGQKRRGGGQNSLDSTIKTRKGAAFRASLTCKMNASFIHPFLDHCFSASLVLLRTKRERSHRIKPDRLEKVHYQCFLRRYV